MKTGGKCEEFLEVSVLGAIVALCGITYSLQAIFFPQEAEKKGANPFDYGLIFSIYELVILYWITNYWCKYSQVFTSVLQNKYLFLVSCSILRIAEGIGATLVVIGTYTIVCLEFPDKIAMYTGLIQTLFNVGVGVGPTIGAPIYQLGGFSLPFLGIGSCLLVLMIFVFFLIPNSATTTTKQDGFGMMKLLRIPLIQLFGIIIIIMGASMGFLMAHLEPHLRQINLTKMHIALVMLIMNVTWALSSPLWGIWIDKMGKPSRITFLGILVLIVAFLLVGPSTFLPIKLSLPPIVIGLFLCGIGQAAATISSFIAMLNEAQLNGYTDPLSTAAYVSSLNTSFICLGGFIGPSLGGILITYTSFRAATDFVMVAFVLLAIALGASMSWRASHPPVGEYKPIGPEKDEKFNK